MASGSPLPVVRVHGEGVQALRNGSLMVYRKWVRPAQHLDAAALVIVEDAGTGDVLGCGFYDTHGPVALRVIELGDCSFSSAWEAIVDRLERAYRLRRALGYAAPGRAYRLVHSDGDLLPGLIVDVYDGLVVYQSSSIVWDTLRDTLVNALAEVLGEDVTVYEKSVQRTRLDIGLRPVEGLRRQGRYGLKVVVEEGSVKLVVDPRIGQKTGLFLDQRLNRIETERLVAGLLDGDAAVLDLFSYTGGFGLHALAAGARSVVFVEEDAKAVTLLRENLRVNRLEGANVRVVNDDVWKALRTLPNRSFDFVVVDPPAFIPDEKAKSRGMQAYYHIYRHAARLAKPLAVLFLSSCSAFLSRDEFRMLVTRALRGMNYRVVGDVRGLPADHPSRLSDPHLSYLKSVFIVLEGPASPRG